MSKSISTLLVCTILFFAFLGFADSAYLLAKRLSGGPIPCALGFTGCDTVDKSSYSAFLGIPLALYGTIFYLLVGFLAMFYLDTKKVVALRMYAILATLGFLSSVYFVYLQAYVIKAFCIFCLFSAAVSTILFILGIIVYRKIKGLEN